MRQYLHYIGREERRERGRERGREGARIKRRRGNIVWAPCHSSVCWQQLYLSLYTCVCVTCKKRRFLFLAIGREGEEVCGGGEEGEEVCGGGGRGNGVRAGGGRKLKVCVDSTSVSPQCE